MKKFFYYTIPFIFIPVVLLLFEYMDNTNIIRMSPHFMIITLIVISFIMGILSPSYNKYDYIITIIMPLSFFSFMFIAGFCDKDDLETMFHLDRAFKTAFQPLCIVSYCSMAISAFLSSHKKIRMKIAKCTKRQLNQTQCNS